MSTLEIAIVAEIKIRRTYEQARQAGKTFVTATLPQAVTPVLQRLYRLLVAWVIDYDKHHAKDMPCDESILCLREYKRHKKNCPLNTNYKGDSCPNKAYFSCNEVH